jgi:hypothetical protein
MESTDTKRARSFEQDLLWSVLDQDAVPHILNMARDHWGLDAATAWAALQQQAVLGRLRAYRGMGPFTPADLAALSLAEAAQDFVLFVEPTEATHARLAELGEITKN